MATYNNIKKIKIGDNIFNLYDSGNSGGTITSVKTTAGAHTAINVTSGAANFNVPTKTSHLTNDSGFLTSHQTAVTSLTTTAGAHTTKSSATGAVSIAIPTKTSHLTNDSGFVTTDEKLKVEQLSNNTTYSLILSGTSGTAATKNVDSDFKYVYMQNDTSTGSAKLTLGNSTASGTAGNKQGQLILYGSTAYAHTLVGAPTSNRTITLPNATGTVALTSDIPTITDTYSSTSSNGMSGKAVASALSNYLPLNGGTMTGNIIMDGLGILGKSSINDNANYLIVGLNKTNNYIYIGSSDGRSAGIPVGIYGSNIYLGTSGDLTLSGDLTVDGTTVKIGLGTSEALYTAINTAGWVSSVIVS